jgi:hypothetical protein
VMHGVERGERTGLVSVRLADTLITVRTSNAV